MTYTLLKKPLTIEEMKEQVTEEGYISGVVAVDLTDIIDDDLESFNDRVSEALVGSPILMDISWRIVGCLPASLDTWSVGTGEIHLQVTGNVTEIIDMEEEEGEE